MLRVEQCEDGWPAGKFDHGGDFDFEIRDHYHGCKDGWLEIKQKDDSKIRNIEKKIKINFSKKSEKIRKKIQKKNDL